MSNKPQQPAVTETDFDDVLTYIVFSLGQIKKFAVEAKPGACRVSKGHLEKIEKIADIAITFATKVKENRK